jgi:hypothetical protein
MFMGSMKGIQNLKASSSSKEVDYGQGIVNLGLTPPGNRPKAKTEPSHV